MNRPVTSVTPPHFSTGVYTLRNLRDSHGFKPEEVRPLAAQFPERFSVERVENQTGKGGHPSEVLRLANLAR